MGWRARYHVIAGAAFVATGAVILTRSVVGRVYPVGLLGLVFIALGVVRVREYWLARQ